MTHDKIFFNQIQGDLYKLDAETKLIVNVGDDLNTPESKRAFELWQNGQDNTGIIALTLIEEFRDNKTVSDEKDIPKT